jgi:ABC-type nitrate/sulfonate/bicarbonate transport system substrate-binding protein
MEAETVTLARFCTALFACAVLTMGTVAADAPQKIRLTVATYEVAQGPYLVAVAKGYFAAEGLDVDLIFSGGGTATPALISGSVDGSASSASALSAILRGAALRIVLVFADTPIYNIWGQPSIHSLADFKGKAIGVATRGDTFEVASRLALQKAGIPADAVGFTPIGSGDAGSAAFESGALAGVVLSTSQSAQLIDKGQLKNAHVVYRLKGNIHMPFDGFVVQQKLLTDNPVLARKIVRAIVKGSRYIHAFKTQTEAILNKYDPSETTRAMNDDYEEFLNAASADLTVSTADAQTDLDVRAALLGIPKDQVPPLDHVYDFSLVRSVNAELNASRWKPTP